MIVLEGGCRVSSGEPLSGQAIALRMVELGGGGALASAEHDQVLYVLDGHGSVRWDEAVHEVASDTGLYLPAGHRLIIERGPLRAAAVETPAQRRPGAKPRLARLFDQPAHATGDRWYRVLIDEQATQFVGGIPPGRAPDHYHLYEEVLVILVGHGMLWAGASSAAIAPSVCIYLPRKQVHSVENTGTGELRLLGVFYPAGSPAVRYAP